LVETFVSFQKLRHPHAESDNVQSTEGRVPGVIVYVRQVIGISCNRHVGAQIISQPDHFFDIQLVTTPEDDRERGLSLIESSRNRTQGPIPLSTIQAGQDEGVWAALWVAE